MKKLVLFGCLVFIAQMANAANWYHVATNSSDNAKAYIDLDSVEAHYFDYNKSQWYLTVWEKYVRPTAQKLDNGKSYFQIKALTYYDCSNKKITASEAHYYNNQGKFVDSAKAYISTSSSDNWANVIPDSVGEAKLQAVCTHYQGKLATKHH